MRFKEDVDKGIRQLESLRCIRDEEEATTYDEIKNCMNRLITQEEMFWRIWFSALNKMTKTN